MDRASRSRSCGSRSCRSAFSCRRRSGSSQRSIWHLGGDHDRRAAEQERCRLTWARRQDRPAVGGAQCRAQRPGMRVHQIAVAVLEVLRDLPAQHHQVLPSERSRRRAIASLANRNPRFRVQNPQRLPEAVANQNRVRNLCPACPAGLVEQPAFNVHAAIFEQLARGTLVPAAIPHSS